MTKKTYLTLVLSLSVLLPGFLATSLAFGETEPEWTEVAKSDIVTVYRKEVPGSSVYAYKGEARIAAPLDKVISIIFDTERRTEWAERVSVAKLIKKPSPFEKWEYFVTRVPWPLLNRDFVTHSTITPNKEKKTLTLYVKSEELPEYPEQKGLIRGMIHFARFEMKSVDGGKATELLAESHADPRGMIPAFVVNIIQKTFPQKTIANILKQAAKPDIVPHPIVAQYGLMDESASTTLGAAKLPKERKPVEDRKQ